MMERITNLESRLDRQEKKEKKNNIIVKGIEIGNSTNIPETVRNVITKELKVEPNIVEAHRLGRRSTMILVKLNSFENKLTILKNKHKLTNKSIYIDNDYTKQERYVQAQIRRRAKEEKLNGHRVKIYYRKILIDDKWYEWNDNENQLIEHASKN
ncbi:hypothetical protein QE152_g39038 [Popillia japonica]|uniref:Uncharacterized protein n=1 Tax=Popillia japonica TaxID=7064 RepID=A0AAW1HV00_POPJA